MKFLSFFGAVLSAALFCAPTLASSPPAYEGQRLYVSYCQLCHGVQGLGDGPLAKKMNIHPANLTTTLRSRSDTILKKIIMGRGRQTITGRERHNLLSEAMPQWESVFTEHQVDALIAYLRFLSTSKHSLMGDPDLGYGLYQKYCVVCHGEDGDGEGIMTKLMDISPTDHSSPSAMNVVSNAELMETIQYGKGEFMPGWKDILSEPEIEALISYIRLLSN